MSYTFQKGDVVILKSGGPEMTIDSRDTYSQDVEKYKCFWFVEGNLQKDSFDVATLEKAE
ncbi:YodC family protein [Xenorhabdus szentirmaii]|uniref:YodC family protein n=1 Tax=Xenorhabdus szentirmaii TaxID=290112 RepID=UPI000C05532E|nr:MULTISPECIES: DUF2158 domain-containing protein [Xenorhabdus]MBD2827055.1 DUF2158 domain-containing protein [Xenorhabdus sp. 5]PHM40505.1 hypothetical protein Xszus_00165 [Xenorhabdus szentirmaii]PHM42356.1 hypothetical protein Xszus_02090 [Xenorhabdus szentirmaii]